MQSAFPNMYDFNEQTWQTVPNYAFKHTFICNFLYFHSVCNVFSVLTHVFSVVFPFGFFCEQKHLVTQQRENEVSILIFFFTYANHN